MLYREINKEETLNLVVEITKEPFLKSVVRDNFPKLFIKDKVLVLDKKDLSEEQETRIIEEFVGCLKISWCNCTILPVMPEIADSTAIVIEVEDRMLFLFNSWFCKEYVEELL